ncbi:MAG: DUF6171 family protein [Lachnospiraceae bacterium]|nr:DUF6171 family protein [Lachnospiraceae bacterium]
MGNRFCRKCLLSEMKEDEYFVDLKQYINNIDNDKKVENDEYQRRLVICKNCDHLISGMCGKCGCYVELRAVMKNGYCPDTKKKW